MRCWKNSAPRPRPAWAWRSEEHTSELQSQSNLVCRLLLEKKKKQNSHSSLCLYSIIHLPPHDIAHLQDLQKRGYMRVVTHMNLSSHAITLKQTPQPHYHMH